MLQANMCPSSGETTVFMRQLVLVILYGRLSCIQGGIKAHSFHSSLHNRHSSIQNNNYQVLHKYSCFSWWWAQSRPKHVEKRNKRTKKNCAPSWLYLQDVNGVLGSNLIEPNVTEGLLQLCVTIIFIIINYRSLEDVFPETRGWSWLQICVSFIFEWPFIFD